MTSTHAVPTTVPSEWPSPVTPALLHRKLVAAADPATLSVFADDWWDLTPGLFESHVATTRLNFTAVPAQFRDPVKHYIWQVINHEPTQRLRHARGTRLALRSIALALPRLNAFVVWLDSHGINSFDAVTNDALDRYLNDVILTEATTTMKAALLIEVRRLWSYRERIAAVMRLPAAVLWDGEEPQVLVGRVVAPRENRTPRIATDTIDLLLMWSLRFVEDFADDIINAFHEHLMLFPRSPATRNPTIQATHRPVVEVMPDLIAYLNRLTIAGEALPGRLGPDGNPEVDWPHLVRLFNSSANAFRPTGRLRLLVERSGLPIAETAYLDSPITGRLDSHPWRDTRIGYTEAPQLAMLLRTACLVTVSYLSGMRTGETLNLARDCLSHDPITGIWLVTGRQFKSAWDTHGDKIPEGELRHDPWVIEAQTARAIQVLQRLHDQPLLFPSQMHPYLLNRGRTRQGQGRSAARVPHDIAALMHWVTTYCQDTARQNEVIPPDPHGLIGASRFRRTLAWHIVRKPRGLIASAIQYGHLHVQMTLGYSGTYDSGFPDEHAYEDWLFRLERLAEDHERLTAGEHVSGPAAQPYRHRVHTAHQQFAGRVLANTQQAHDLLANPLLQIYPGRAMTCVFDQTKALCQLRSTDNDQRVTPDQDDCRPNCHNIAYTDRDIATLRTHAAELEDLLANSLAPSPRQHRTRTELTRLRHLIHHHRAAHS